MSAVVSVDFAASRSAAEQREIRRIIRNTKRTMLTKAERDVLMVLVNLWFYHKGGRDKYINPGRAKVAKKADVSQATVKRSLETLKAYGVIYPVAYENGGNRKTCYAVDLMAIRETFDPHGVEEKDGELVRFSGKNDPLSSGSNDPLIGPKIAGQNDPRIYKDGQDHLGQDWLSVSESLIDYEDADDA